MSQTKVTNLCGASAEFNAMQDQFNDMINDVLGGLESEALSLASLLGDAFNLLLTDIRVLIPELPALPDINLQSVITSLSSLTEGTSAYTTLLADIVDEFGTDLTALGLDLDTLIPDALTEILGGGDGCSIIPNIRKAAGGLTDSAGKLITAYEVASNSLMGLNLSASEGFSPWIHNVEFLAQKTDLGLRVKKMITEVSTAPDVVVDTITAIVLPTSDIGIFTVTDKTIGYVYDLGNTIEVTTLADQDGKNITSGGFARRRTKAKERFKESDITQSGDTWTIKLTHPPAGVGTLKGNCLITRGSKEVQAMIHVTPKGEPNELSRGNRNQGKAYYEVDGQTIKITGKGHDFFPHSDQHSTYYQSYLEDIQFHISYDYFANYDPSFVKFS